MCDDGDDVGMVIVNEMIDENVCLFYDDSKMKK